MSSVQSTSFQVSGGLTTTTTSLQTTSDKPLVNLEAIRHLRGDINGIRMLLKGDFKLCFALFKHAVEEGDAISQIQLSHAHFGMRMGNDSTKNFSSLVADDLEKFFYYPREFTLLNLIYDEAMEVTSDRKTSDARSAKTFELAANRGYLPAFLELTQMEWKKNANSFGFAVQLRPFVGKGDKLIDFYFGNALKNGCQIGSDLYYEGLYWIHQSGYISLKFPEENQKFDDFIESYVRKENCKDYHDQDGLRLVGYSVLLVPSRRTWETFLKEKLGSVKVAPMDSYVFKFDFIELETLLKKYKIGAVQTSQFVKSSTEENKAEGLPKKPPGFQIQTLSLYDEHEYIGEISVQENTFKIHKTFENSKIKPIIDFIESVMTRTGSAHSAYAWLDHLGAQRR